MLSDHALADKVLSDKGATRLRVGPLRALGRPRPGWSWDAAALTVAGLLAVPVVVVLYSLAQPFGEVWHHLASTVLSRYVANTLILTAGVLLGVFVIGVGTAWLVTMCAFPGRRVFEWALFLPLAVPAYVLAYAYTGFLDYAGPVQTLIRDLFGVSYGEYWFPEIRSMGGAITLLTLVLYPYVYMLARAAFIEQCICVLEISRTLGCSSWRAFFTVALPLARPAIAGGMALAAMEALGDFGTVDYFAVDTFTAGIFRTWSAYGDLTATAQLAGVLLLFVLAVLLFERLSRGGGRFHHTSRRYQAIKLHPLRGRRAVLAFLACFTPILFGFLLPGLLLGIWAVQEIAGGALDATFARLALNSLHVAAVTALIAAGVGLILAYSLRMRPTAVTRGAVRTAGLGYAVPGMVVAVGVIIALAWADRQVNAWLVTAFGWNPGLLFSGTMAALVFAYLVRFLAVSFNTVEASLAKVTPGMDAAARSLGERPAGVLWRVHLPLLRGSMLTAGLLVFVDVMKELPATLVLRPFNFNTLAVRAFELAADERLRETALPALAIVAVGIVPVILLSRSIGRSRPGARAAQSQEGM